MILENPDREIELKKLFRIIWEDKLYILLFALIPSMIFTAMEFTNKSQRYETITFLLPNEDEELYEMKVLNTSLDLISLQSDKGLRRINQVDVGGEFRSKSAELIEDEMLSLFVPPQLFEEFLIELSNPKFVEGIISKHGFLDSNIFESDKEYRIAIKRLANQIEITEYKNIEADEIFGMEDIWVIKIVHNEKDFWERFIEIAYSEANEKVRKKYLDIFIREIELAKFIRKIQLETLASEREVLLDINEEWRSDRIQYLKEQAEIARHLGIEMPSSDFSSINGYLNAFEYEGSKPNGDFPLYLSGYRAIEKEITIIQNWNEKSLFIPGVLDASTKSLMLERDNKINEFQKLLDDFSLNTKDGFSLAKSHYLSTTVVEELESNFQSLLILIAIIGAFVGVIFSYIKGVQREARRA